VEKVLKPRRIIRNTLPKGINGKKNEFLRPLGNLIQMGMVKEEPIQKWPKKFLNPIIK